MDCPAITNGVTVFTDGRIRPCCLTAAEYSKPLSCIQDPNRFTDLIHRDRPAACRACWQAEDNGIVSLRHYYKQKVIPDNTNIQFLDFRLSNQCNLKCRYCGPHFSNQWAKELSIAQPLKQVDVSEYHDDLFNENLTDLYWCGGEPLILKEHYEINKLLIDKNLSKNISLRYNTNLTVLKYKDIDIIDIWKQFKDITLDVSLDAANDVVNYIRSGSDWQTIDKNINFILNSNIPNLKLRFTPVVSALNIWFLPELLSYAKSRNIPVMFYALDNPDYLSLSVLPKELKEQARQILESSNTHNDLSLIHI